MSNECDRTFERVLMRCARLPAKACQGQGHDADVPLPLSHPSPRTPVKNKASTNLQQSTYTSTPIVPKPSTMVVTDHVRDEIYPLLRHDLYNHNKTIPVDDWVGAFLGVPPQTLSGWEDHFRQGEVLLDGTIEENMEMYRERTEEAEGYVPWANISNQIVAKAHEYIPDLPKRSLSDLLFIRNDPVRVCSNGVYYSQRSPDVLVTLKSIIRDLPINQQKGKGKGIGTLSTKGIRWGDVISCVEFKYKKGDTKEVFAEWEKRVNELRELKQKKRTRPRNPKSKVMLCGLDISRYSSSLV